MLMATKKDINQSYDKFAKWYDCVVSLPDFFLVKRLREDLFRKASGKVLEIATGTGRNLSYYSDHCEVTLTDMSCRMLDKALCKARKRKMLSSILQMDAEQLGLRDNCFDTVVDSLALCTFTQPVSALREMSRVCKPGGRVLLLEHGKSSKEWLGHWQSKVASTCVERIGCHWDRDVLDLVEKSGLRIISNRCHFFGMFHSIMATPRKHIA